MHELWVEQFCDLKLVGLYSSTQLLLLCFKESLVSLLSLFSRRSQVIEKFEALDIENAEHMETNAPGGAALSSETRQGRSEKRVFPRKRVRCSAKESWKDETWNPAALDRGFSYRVCPWMWIWSCRQLLQELNLCVCSVCVIFPALLPWARCRLEKKIRLSLLSS